MPAVASIVNRSIADGHTMGLVSVAGLELGNFVHIVAAGIGLSAVLTTSATAFTVVQWPGVAYLVTIGIRSHATRPERLAGLGLVAARATA